MVVIRAAHRFERRSGDRSWEVAVHSSKPRGLQTREPDVLFVSRD